MALNSEGPDFESKLLLLDLITEVVGAELQLVISGVLDAARAAAMRLGVVDVLARRLTSGTLEQKWQGVLPSMSLALMSAPCCTRA